MPAIPIRRIEIPQSAPIFSYALLGTNIVVFLLDTFIFRGWLTAVGAKQNDAILSGQYWRLISPLFLHGGIVHLGLNSYFLYVVGPQVERAFGHMRFLGIYLLAGLAGSIASFALSPGASIGASGALFGLVGALIPLLYRNRHVLAHTQRHISSIIQVIIINLVIGFTIPRIDNWGHIGGLLGGLALAWLTTPRYKVESDFEGRPVRVVDQTSPALTTLSFGAVSIVLLWMLFIVFWLRS